MVATPQNITVASYSGCRETLKKRLIALGNGFKVTHCQGAKATQLSLVTLVIKGYKGNPIRVIFLG